MPAWMPVWRSTLTHPRTVDALLALCLFVFPLVTPKFERILDLAVAPQLVAGTLVCGAIALRRRWPLPTLAVGTVAAIGAILATEAETPYPVMIAFLAYTVATEYRRTVAWAWVGGSAALLVAAAGLVNADHLTLEIARPVGWMGMATAIGGALHIQRAYVAEVEERARRAERTRDEVTARHVAEERLLIARELHDVVAHRIAVINVQAGVAGHLVHTKPAEAAEAIAHIRTAGRAVLGELSTLLGVLRDTRDGTEDATAPTQPTPRLARLGELLDSFTVAGLTVELTVEPPEGPTDPAGPLPDAVDLAAYRIIQESLTNVHKHGSRRHAAVRLEHRAKALVVEVRNTAAPGAAPVPSAPTRGGHGIIGMRERAASVGGELRAESQPDGGFLVAAVLPRSGS